MSEFMITAIWFFLIGLCLIVTWQLLTGRINLSGLLYEESATGNYSPGRVQLLLITLTTAVYYLLKVAHDPTRLPGIPREVLLLSGGGNIVYLFCKVRSLLKNIKGGSDY